MEKIINGTSISPEENNALLEEGFLFRVKGDWEIAEGIDGWSGMPNTKGNIHYFTNADEAEAYAAKQVWVFNSDVHGTVEAVSHMETRAEYEAKMANGMSCRNYLAPADFVEEYADWMEEICTEIFPKNFEKDGIWYCLLIYG